MSTDSSKRSSLGVGALTLSRYGSGSTLNRGPMGLDSSAFRLGAGMPPKIPYRAQVPARSLADKFSLLDVRLTLDRSLPVSRSPLLSKLVRELPRANKSKLQAVSFRLDSRQWILGPLEPWQAVGILLEMRQPAAATELNRSLLLDEAVQASRSFWLVYENDGDPPFNPGSGSDQGPTARLSMFVTFNDKRSGLAKIGVTVIGMQTPKGTLRPGDVDGPESTYQAGKGPYVGRTSIDFEVIVRKDREIEIKLLGAAGVDSGAWGKLVQDTIHKYVSKSPLFPWKADTLKPFLEAGVAALWKPDMVLSENEVLGLKYKARIEFDAKAITGTHRTEFGAGANIVLRSATVKTGAGDFSVEYTPAGVFARGFARYNDGRPDLRFGVEGGARSSLMLRLGRFGLGLEGELTSSTDPALQTDNPAGSQPLLSPVSGGPQGHHGLGRVLLRVDL